MERTCICIDLKSYYASVECVARGLDPLKARLLVADRSRSDQTICLAVSPALKAIGVPARPRLFEAKQAIERYDAQHHTKTQYYVAAPRMAEYERISALIFSIYLHYAAPEDVHVYSIDEAFIDCTAYLSAYRAEAEREGVSPARFLAKKMIREVLAATGITATVGIGTNLYLAKVAMDIVAKKAPPDENGVRIAELDPLSYRKLLWDHRPLTDFWQIGPGKARRLTDAGLCTMGDIAERSLRDEEYFYRAFGIDGEILIDHAWGLEPVRMEDIKSFRSDSNSLSSGQVLPRPYRCEEARVVFREMADLLCADLFSKNLTTPALTWWVSYDYKSLEENPNYAGPVKLDFYGRLHPCHSGGTVRLRARTNAFSVIERALLASFDAKADPTLLFRRLSVCAEEVRADAGADQLDLFTDYAAQEKEKRLCGALLDIKKRHGANSVLKGTNFLEGATARERNLQIGGHRA
ncbi:MAG: DNA methylase [Oscillospiraceae bacterium]|nr:DNA methylase [Oscillospiraceae bacterium]